jgi:Flp pilus assembly protein TadB
MELRSGTLTEATAREFNRAFKVEQDRRKLAEEMRRKDLRESAFYATRDRVVSHQNLSVCCSFSMLAWSIVFVHETSRALAFLTLLAMSVLCYFAVDQLRKSRSARRTLEALQADTSTR